MNQEQYRELLAIMDDAKQGLKTELSMRRDLSLKLDSHPDYWSEENLEKAISEIEDGQEMLQEEMA